MIDSDFVLEIERLTREGVKPEFHEYHGEVYSTKNLSRIKPPAIDFPPPIELHSLSGIVDYLTRNPDHLELSNVAVIVRDPTLVDVASNWQKETGQRAVFIRAKTGNVLAGTPFMGGAFRPGEWWDLEKLVIAVQALFDNELGERAEFLKLIGNVRNENIRTSEDDGVTQTVAARAGVTVVDEVDVKNPWRLQPYTTFPEVGQPLIPFVLRLRQWDAGVQGAVFQADGDRWKIEARQSIRGWLEDKIPEEVHLLS